MRRRRHAAFSSRTNSLTYTAGKSLLQTQTSGVMVHTLSDNGRHLLSGDRVGQPVSDVVSVLILLSGDSGDRCWTLHTTGTYDLRCRGKRA